MYKISMSELAIQKYDDETVGGTLIEKEINSIDELIAIYEEAKKNAKAKEDEDYYYVIDIMDIKKED